MKFDLKKIVKKDMSSIACFVDAKYKRYLAIDSGEHYKFLATLSDLFSDEILVDIGTFKGVSAMSLAMNRQNQIITVNINVRSNFIKMTDLPIEQVVCDILEVKDNKYLTEKIQQSILVILDITHNGRDEKKFYNFLLDINYKGILICDDIKLRRLGDMPGFWNSIAKTKYDLSKYGHWSGTGLVDFDNKLEIKGL